MKSRLIKISTKNFKGLGNFLFEPKSNNINIIYGDNGVGKSSFVKIFNFLTIIIENIRLRSLYYSRSIFPSQISPISPELINPYKEFSSLLNDDEIEIDLIIKMNDDFYQYGFCLNKQNHITKEYFYLLKKTNLKEVKKIIFEKKLYDSYEIDKNYLKDFKTISKELDDTNVNSFISILNFNIIDQNYENTSEKFIDFKNSKNPIILLVYLFTMLNVANHETTFENIYYRPITIIPVLKIHPSKKDLKEKFKNEAKEFEDFVLSIDNKIREVKVMENISNDGRELSLSLEFKQYINGKIVYVPFELMSSGTKDYLKYFKIITLLSKDCSNNLKNTIGVFDEFGIHLHPTLLIKILEYINKIVKKNNSQIFFTSHQAILLDKKYTNLENKEKLIMTRDSRGNTKIRTLIGEGNKDNNYEKYIRGEYGGNNLNKIIN